MKNSPAKVCATYERMTGKIEVRPSGTTPGNMQKAPKLNKLANKHGGVGSKRYNWVNEKLQKIELGRCTEYQGRYVLESTGSKYNNIRNTKAYTPRTKTYSPRCKGFCEPMFGADWRIYVDFAGEFTFGSNVTQSNNKNR